MMKKHNCYRESTGGAALMIALITAVIVMLAATLLITLTEKMVNSHGKRITDAQVSLSEASAADGLAYLFEVNGIAMSTDPPSFELAGVRTEFTLVSRGTSGIRNGFYSLDNPSRSVVIPAGEHLVSATCIDENTVSIVFYSDETFRAIDEITISTAMRPVAGTPLSIQGEDGAVVVLQGGGETMFCAVNRHGIVASCTVEALDIDSGSNLSAGSSNTGDPLLIVTGGSNTGIILDLTNGQSTHVFSQPGTCPVFMADGSVFGSISGGSPSFSIARVRDVFSGDFNSDGVGDMAFATSFSLSVYSGSTGELYCSGPGGSLVCWGEVQGRNGLVGMWSMPGGEEKWFRLGYQGFTEFVPEMIYRMGWEGRFTGSGNTFAGFLDEKAVVASSSGHILELFGGEIFTGNADGGELDYFLMQEDGLEAYFNPVSGDGIQMVFESVNTYRGEKIPGSTHVFSIYESGDRRRVFHNLEGMDS